MDNLQALTLLTSTAGAKMRHDRARQPTPAEVGEDARTPPVIPIALSETWSRPCTSARLTRWR
jgi:hypothetical protein